MNKIYKILGYIVILLSVVGTTNAIPIEEWNRTYNVDSIRSSQQTIDGGYIIIGSSYLIKTNIAGNSQWSKNYMEELHSGQQTSDGGYILAGTNYSVETYPIPAQITKTDVNGNTLWTKSFENGDITSGMYVQQTTDGGYILMGCTWDSSLPFNVSKNYYGDEDDQNMIIIKTDSNGNELWNKFPGSGCIWSGQQIKYGGYILLGGINIGDTLIKTDSNGNNLWSKRFGGTDLKSIQQTRDGGYVLAGRQGSDGLVIKTDIYGNRQWNKTFGGTNSDWLSSVRQTIAGNFILAGSTKSYGVGGYDVWIIKTDIYGNKLWSKTFGGTRDDFANSVYQTKDKGYILAGSKNSKAWLIKLNDIIITVVSPNGGENWARNTIQTIKWTSSGNPGTNVKIDLYKAGVFKQTIVSSTPNDGSHPWTIPSTQMLGTDYKIKITSASNSVYTDTSDNNFVIGGINIISPNGGESWQRGTTKTITWSKDGSTGANVKIELFKSGVLNRIISSSTPNDGSFSWIVPSTQTLGIDYKIKITSTSNSAYNDLSNNYFRIS